MNALKAGASSMSRNVLIIGASRGIGRETVRKALEAGHHVTAFARHAPHYLPDDARLRIIEGDATSYSDIEQAMQGQDCVITTLGMGPTREKVTLFSMASTHICNAMSTHNITRLIAVTGIGTGNSKGIGGSLFSQFIQPLFLATIHEDKTREEEIIKASELNWTIVRPGYLTRLPPKGTYHALINPQEWRGGFISRTDVADFLVQQIEATDLIHQTPLLISD